jgi:hypothetical protein
MILHWGTIITIKAELRPNYRLAVLQAESSSCNQPCEEAIEYLLEGL